MEESWVLAHFDRSDGFPRPDWDAISPRIYRETPESERGPAFTQAAEQWLLETAAMLDGDYGVMRSPHFLLLSSMPPKRASRMIVFLERTRELIVNRHLPGIATSSGYGSHVVILFADMDTYYSYIDYHYPRRGEFAGSGGILLQGRAGRVGMHYVHFVSYGVDTATIERVASHELTHNCLMHLRIPLWLNEGLAQMVEYALVGGPTITMTREDLEEHRATWRDGGIQSFWSGRAVHNPSNASRLAYHLAHVMTKAMSADYERFRKFVLSAKDADAGEAAMREVYGRSLGDFVGHILGPGDWIPEPQAWANEAD